jgi:hypothetical protein
MSFNYNPTIKGSGEVQTPLNQKVNLKSSGAVDFALKFIIFINSKFEIRTFNNYYESRCKINDSRKL